MLIGIVVGCTQPEFAKDVEFLGEALIRMIQCITGPLIFVSLVTAIANNQDRLSRLQKFFVLTVLSYMVLTVLALFIGLLFVNVIKPGKGNFDPKIISPVPPSDIPAPEITLATFMRSIIPTSFFLALTDHSAILAIVFCALMFGFGLTKASQGTQDVLMDLISACADALDCVLTLIINYAPIGIAFSVAGGVARFQGDLARTGALLGGTLLAGLCLFVFVILVPLLLVSRIPLWAFVKSIKFPIAIAFSTASSETALVPAIKKTVEFGVPRDTAAFILTTGYSFNLQGSAIHLMIASVFCAQVSGMELTISKQLQMLGSLILMSKAVAAVPRASFIVLTAVLSAYSIPASGLALIMAIDVFMDMFRSAVNLFTNMTCAVLAAKWGGKFRSAEWRKEVTFEGEDTAPQDSQPSLPVHDIVVNRVGIEANNVYPNTTHTNIHNGISSSGLGYNIQPAYSSATPYPAASSHLGPMTPRATSRNSARPGSVHSNLSDRSHDFQVYPDSTELSTMSHTAGRSDIHSYGQYNTRGF
ncbi:hypothetical protein BGW38_007201 [Lunasporangiospora selenospora]|uniref:Amino acid transporter n=1 Tax=Lunasporangiospora selenospora TaxID=979761 RepID=A0A9P6FM09_9FUNG|nr:hypothetical protein BGW38_007201 [Lunasporangiospora selenospora]